MIPPSVVAVEFKESVRSSHPQKVPRRRSSATPHKVTFEDGGEMAVFQQPDM
jgi:hypothetical protein